MEKTLGQIAYEAYCEDCGNKSIRGEELPTWNNQSDEIKQHWEAAGLATCKVGGNYVANNEVYPVQVTFANGRKVKAVSVQREDIVFVYLEVE